MKIIICYMLSFLLLSTTLATASSTHVQALIKDKLNAAILVLKTDNLSDQDKKERIANIVLPIFDMGLMAKLSVGGNHWRNFSDIQKEKFTDAFNHRLQSTYLNTIMGYKDEQIVYKTPVHDKNRAYIPLDLVTVDGNVEMIYKLYQKNDTWKIYDVEIKGVSIIRSYRFQIDEILKNSSFEELLSKFEKVSS